MTCLPPLLAATSLARPGFSNRQEAAFHTRCALQARGGEGEMLAFIRRLGSQRRPGGRGGGMRGFWLQDALEKWKGGGC